MARGDALRCPFCEAPLVDPQEVKGPFGNVFSGGRCTCGAFYVFDRTGHNMGEAYVDLLGLACDGDMNRAWSLDPEKDYEMRDLTYNTRRNKFGAEAIGRVGRTPVYLFLKMKQCGTAEDYPQG